MQDHIYIKWFGVIAAKLPYGGLTILLSMTNLGQWTKDVCEQIKSALILTTNNKKVFAVNKPASVAHTSRVSSTESPVSLSVSMTQYPSGKLGEVVLLMSREGGANIDDLMALTSWRRHTVRAALCRLRQRGFVITAGKCDGRITYTLHQER